MRQIIEQVMRQVAEDSGKQLIGDFGEETVLLESGLDSLDFAIVVARLEEELDDDPFLSMENPVYPKTLADFVMIYEQHFADRAQA